MLCNKIHFIISYFVALSVYNVNTEAYTGSYAHKICLRLCCDSEANASESQPNLRHISVTVIDLGVLEVFFCGRMLQSVLNMNLVTFQQDK